MSQFKAAKVESLVIAKQSNIMLGTKQADGEILGERGTFAIASTLIGALVLGTQRMSSTYV